MKRLLRMSLDTLLMSTLPIVMWILLGVFLDKNISNVFTLTYPIQFVMGLLLAIFGIGANINATKNNKKYLVDSNIILGTIIGLVVTCLLISNVDKYIQFMSMDIEIYKSFCIYSFTLMYLQLVLQLICQKLYYLEKNKEANKLTILFNLINFFIIIILSYITKNQNLSIISCLCIDAFVIILIFTNIVDKLSLKFEILKNIKCSSNDILDRLGMFIVYFIGFRNSFEFGAIYLIAINFETLITDAQWDMSYSIITAAKIDSSKNKLNYKESVKNAYKLMGILIVTSLIMGSVLYFYYKPPLFLISILLGVQIVDMLLIPSVWIKEEYCQINYSPKITTFNQGIEKLIRIGTSFLPTPFCTHIGQILSSFYQIILFNFVYRKKYYIENEILIMK